MTDEQGNKGPDAQSGDTKNNLDTQRSFKGGEAAKRAKEFEEKAKEKEKQEPIKNPVVGKLHAPAVDIRVSHLNQQDGWLQKKAKLKAEQEAKEKAEREEQERKEQEVHESKVKLNEDERNKFKEEEKKKKQIEETKISSDEQKRKATFEFLNKGAIFMKYGRKGSPHTREVFLTSDGYLYWAKPGERQKKERNQVYGF